MIIEKLLTDFNEKIKNSYNTYKVYINKLNLGIATPLIIQNLKIKYYNEQISLEKISIITVKDNKTLKISLFDKNIIHVVNQAILNSNLNLNTLTKGKNIIYIKLPVLNNQNKIMIKKIIVKKTEEFKKSIRNKRREYNIYLQKKCLNKDQLFLYKNKIQKYTDIYIDKISKLYIEKMKLLN